MIGVRSIAFTEPGLIASFEEFALDRNCRVLEELDRGGKESC